MILKDYRKVLSCPLPPLTADTRTGVYRNQRPNFYSSVKAISNQLELLNYTLGTSDLVLIRKEALVGFLMALT